jgi:hypothetical protein
MSRTFITLLEDIKNQDARGKKHDARSKIQES